MRSRGDRSIIGAPHPSASGGNGFGSARETLTPDDRSDDREKRAGTQIQAGCPDPRPVTLFLRQSAAESRRFAAAATDTTDLYPRIRPSLAHAAPSPLRPPSSTLPSSPFSPPRTFPLSSFSLSPSLLSFLSLFLFLPPSLSLSLLLSLSAPPLCAVHPFRSPSRITVCGQHRRILGSGSMIVISSLSYFQVPLPTWSFNIL